MRYYKESIDKGYPT